MLTWGVYRYYAVEMELGTSPSNTVRICLETHYFTQANLTWNARGLLSTSIKKTKKKCYFTTKLKKVYFFRRGRKYVSEKLGVVIGLYTCHLAGDNFISVAHGTHPSLFHLHNIT